MLLRFDYGSELSPEFQRLKAEHLEKMAGLKQESEMLKQLTEIERMKKELNELKGDKLVVADDRDKQVRMYIKYT